MKKVLFLTLIIALLIIYKFSFKKESYCSLNRDLNYKGSNVLSTFNLKINNSCKILEKDFNVFKENNIINKSNFDNFIFNNLNKLYINDEVIKIREFKFAKKSNKNLNIDYFISLIKKVYDKLDGEDFLFIKDFYIKNERENFKNEYKVIVNLVYKVK